MKIELDLTLTDDDVARIADAVVSKLKDVASINTKAADKPAATTKPKADPKPKAEPKVETPAEDTASVPDQAAVLSALRVHSNTHGRPSALAVLAKFANGSDKATDVSEDDRAALIEALEAAPEVDDDGF